MKRPALPAWVPRDTGTLVLLVGVGHVFLAALLFGDQLADIASAGIVAAVPFGERAGEQAAAIWFAVNGVLLAIVGQLARAYQSTARLPASPGWLLAALGAAGAIVAPVSGFWVYIALGTLWINDSRSQARPDDPARPSPRTPARAPR